MKIIGMHPQRPPSPTMNKLSTEIIDHIVEASDNAAVLLALDHRTRASVSTMSRQLIRNKGMIESMMNVKKAATPLRFKPWSVEWYCDKHNLHPKHSSDKSDLLKAVDRIEGNNNEVTIEIYPHIYTSDFDVISDNIPVLSVTPLSGDDKGHVEVSIHESFTFTAPMKAPMTALLETDCQYYIQTARTEEERVIKISFHAKVNIHDFTHIFFTQTPILCKEPLCENPAYKNHDRCMAHRSENSEQRNIKCHYCLYEEVTKLQYPPPY